MVKWRDWIHAIGKLIRLFLCGFARSLACGAAGADRDRNMATAFGSLMLSDVL